MTIGEFEREHKNLLRRNSAHRFLSHPTDMSHFKEIDFDKSAIDFFLKFVINGRNGASSTSPENVDLILGQFKIMEEETSGERPKRYIYHKLSNSLWGPILTYSLQGASGDFYNYLYPVIEFRPLNDTDEIFYLDITGSLTETREAGDLHTLYLYARGLEHPYFDDATWEKENIESFLKNITLARYNNQLSDTTLDTKKIATLKASLREDLHYIEYKALKGRRRRENRERDVYRHLEDVADGMDEGL